MIEIKFICKINAENGVNTKTVSIKCFLLQNYILNACVGFCFHYRSGNENKLLAYSMQHALRLMYFICYSDC